jgi:hypothetical protein
MLRRKRMAALREEEMEAVAQSVLREPIQRSGRYPGLPDEMRTRRIEEDVGRNWPHVAGCSKHLDRVKRL